MKRSLTPQELALWQYVTRNDTKLHPGQPSQAMPEEMPQPRLFPEIRQWQPRPSGQQVQHEAPASLSCGQYAGIDRATAERFRKGNYPFDGRLDLHGMSREKAHHALMAFIQQHYDGQSRCLLVITGKGGKDGGILRQLLPRWLAEPGCARMLLALDVAQQRHGGSGAYYLLLRRQR